MSSLLEMAAQRLFNNLLQSQQVRGRVAQSFPSSVLFCFCFCCLLLLLVFVGGGIASLPHRCLTSAARYCPFIRLHSFLRSFVRSFLHSVLPSLLPCAESLCLSSITGGSGLTVIPSSLPACLPTSLPSFLCSFGRPCPPSSLLPFLPSFRPPSLPFSLPSPPPLRSVHPRFPSQWVVTLSCVELVGGHARDLLGPKRRGAGRKQQGSGGGLAGIRARKQRANTKKRGVKLKNNLLAVMVCLAAVCACGCV